MTKLPFDPELVFAVLQEMCDRSQLLLKLIPKDFDESRILKHLAASQIHLVQFARDVSSYIREEEREEHPYLARFLEQCGCDFNNNHKEIR
jgi:hypothetical protein